MNKLYVQISCESPMVASKKPTVIKSVSNINRYAGQRQCLAKLQKIFLKWHAFFPAHWILEMSSKHRTAKSGPVDKNEIWSSELVSNADMSANVITCYRSTET